MSPLMKVCNGCGKFIQPTERGRCASCRKADEREKSRLRGRTVYHRPEWKRVRARVLARDGHRCRRCGTPDRLAVHHIVPPKDGGAPLDEANLITLCVGCHNIVDAERRAREEKSNGGGFF